MASETEFLTPAPPGGSALLDGIYIAGLVLGTPYLTVRMLLDARYRHGLAERFGSIPPMPVGRPRVWFHGASAGEILTARALFELMSREAEDLAAVFSALTVTGRRAAQKAFPDAATTYMPIDLRRCVSRALSVAKPDLVVLLEGDIWPNFICAAKSAGARIAVVNGRFSQRSVRFYGRWSRFFRPALEAIDLFCLRDTEQLANILPLEIPDEKIMVTGNIKYDNLQTEPDPETDILRDALGIGREEQVVVAGSTHAGEEGPLFDLAAERNDFRLIVIPRYPRRACALQRFARQKGLSSFLFSQRGEARPGARDVVIVDTVGDLTAMYQLASVAFVGGSLVPRGGQNVMEPAALGIPVLFGRYTHTFRQDVELLMSTHGAIEVADQDNLKSAVSRLLETPQERSRMGHRAREAVLALRGAGVLTFAALKDLLEL